MSAVVMERRLARTDEATGPVGIPWVELPQGPKPLTGVLRRRPVDVRARWTAALVEPPGRQPRSQRRMAQGHRSPHQRFRGVTEEPTCIR